MIGSKLILQKDFSTAGAPSMIQLKPLPFKIVALEPVFCPHLIDLHYGKQHHTYFNNLNELVEQTLEATVKKMPKRLFIFKRTSSSTVEAT